MQIFFTGSLNAPDKHREKYSVLKKLVEKEGHFFNAPHLSNSTTIDALNFKRIISDLKKADAVFAEATFSSISVGFFISLAMQLGKPVVIFFERESGKEPHLFKALEETSEKVQIIRYSYLNEIENEISMIFDFIESSQDTRFNFFVSPELSSYLNWIAKNKRTPRSVYLRDLIEEDMNNYPDFKNDR